MSSGKLNTLRAVSELIWTATSRDVSGHLRNRDDLVSYAKLAHRARTVRLAGPQDGGREAGMVG